MFDERKKSKTFGQFQEFIIGEDNYCRLTVPPLLWLAFQGIDNQPSMLLNLIDYKHDPKETENSEINNISYDWSI